MRIPEPNPRRLGACPHCGNYRLDGRPPHLHRAGCPRQDEVRVALADLEAGPALYETEADAALARQLGVRDAATYGDAPMVTGHAFQAAPAEWGWGDHCTWFDTTPPVPPHPVMCDLPERRHVR